MNPTILKEITQKNLTAYLAARVFRKFYFLDLFPLTYTPYLTAKSITGSMGAPVAADVIAYDASAPLKKRKTVDKVEFDIPKTAISRKMEESQFNAYLTLKAQANANEQRLLDLVYEDVDFCYEGALARLEWFALQALSRARISLTSSNNNGIVTETELNFSPSHTGGAAKAWSTGASTITPMTDIQTMQTTMEDSYGVTLKYLLMDSTSLGYLKASDEAKDWTSAFTIKGKAATLVRNQPTLSAINEALDAHDLPVIVPIKQSITVETGEHAQTSANPWQTGYITGIPDIQVGEMLFGPLAIQQRPPKQITSAVRDGVFVYKYSNVNPFGEWTVAEINAFPSFGFIDNCYFMYTLGTAWA